MRIGVRDGMEMVLRTEVLRGECLECGVAFLELKPKPKRKDMIASEREDSPFARYRH